MLSTPRSHLPPKDTGARVRSTKLSASLLLAARTPVENADSPRSSRLTVLEASGRSQSPTYSRILHPIVHGTYISGPFDTRSNQGSTAIAMAEDSVRMSFADLAVCDDALRGAQGVRSRCRLSQGLHEAETRQWARVGGRFGDVPTKGATCQWGRPWSVLFLRVGSRLRGGRELHQPVVDGSVSIKPMAAIQSSGPKPSLLRSISFARTTT